VPAADTRRVRGGGGGPLTAAAAALLLLGGYNIVRTVAGDAGSGPPAPPSSAARVLPRAGTPSRAGTASFASSPATRQAVFAAAMPASAPVRLTVARVGIDAQVIRVGLSSDGAVGVPPIGDALKAGWYDRGPAPGQNGPAVIDAHVDSMKLPTHRAAFYTLGSVLPGDRVEVTRADGNVAEFTVDSVEMAPKRAFPTAKVYGPLNYPGLRLITCGGAFHKGEGYADNVIVYAHLSGRHHI